MAHRAQNFNVVLSSQHGHDNSTWLPLPANQVVRAAAYMLSERHSRARTVSRSTSRSVPFSRGFLIPRPLFVCNERKNARMMGITHLNAASEAASEAAFAVNAMRVRRRMDATTNRDELLRA